MFLYSVLLCKPSQLFHDAGSIQLALDPVMVEGLGRARTSQLFEQASFLAQSDLAYA